MSADFDFIVECCRWSYAGGSVDPLARMAADANWPMVLRLARRHRVEALAWNALQASGAPLPDFAQTLKADATAVTAHNLRTAAECERILAAFDGAVISLLFVKGLTLAALAYPNPLLKMGWDIDIIVDGGAVARSAELLRTLGYRPRLPAGASDDRLVAWHRKRKESEWHDAGRAMHVDLHSRLADNPLLLPTVGVDSPRQTVEVAGLVALPTLADEELFAFLCVHGASSAWFRLKWIADLAAFLHRRTEALPRLYEHSQQLGAGRAAGQALLLAHRLFGAGDARLVHRLAADRSTRGLAEAAFRALDGRRAIEEPTRRFLGTATIHSTQFALRGDLRFKLTELRRQLRALWR